MNSVNPDSYEQQSEVVIQRLRGLAWAAAILAGLLPPLMSVYLQYHALVEHIQQDAEVQTVIVQRFAMVNPEAWKFKEEHIAVALKGIRHEDSQTLLTVDGQQVMALGAAVSEPALWRWEDILVDGRPAGKLGVAHSAQSLRGHLLMASLTALLITAFLLLIIDRLIFRRLKQVNSERHVSDERLRDLVSLSSDWFWEQDDQFRFTAMSEGIDRAHISRKNVLGKCRWELAIDLTSEQLAAHQRDLQAHRSFKLEYPIRDENGVTRWFFAQGLPLFERNGRFVGYRGIGRDITEQVQTREELTRHRNHLQEMVQEQIVSLNQLSLAVAQSPTAVIITDIENCIEYANAAYCRLTGFSESEVHGKYPTDLQSNRDELIMGWNRQLNEDLWRSVSQKQLWQGQFVCRKKSGETYLDATRVTPVLREDGSVTGYLYLKQDVTVEVRGQSLLRATLESTRDGILVIDSDRRVTMFNQRFLELWRIPPELAESRDDEKLLGHILDQLSDPQQFISKVLELYQTPEKSSQDLIYFKDGRVFDRHSLPQWIDSEAVGRVWSFADISEQYHSRQTLEQAKAEAELANLAKSQFLANMSHEIRTPMNAVLGLAQIGVRENSGRQTGKTCGMILEAGQHLLGVINDILDFSKIEAGKMTLERKSFRLAAEVERVLGLIGERAHTKGLKLDVTFDAVAPAPTFVLGDSLRIGQVLLNLLANAIKFTEHGTVSLTITHAGTQTLFRIADTGTGMTGEQLARLFIPFEQADKSTTRKYGGSGLGLAISRQLALLMGGDISVTSTPDSGSVFTLYLPLPVAEPPSVEVPVGALATGGPQLTGLRILAAEDVELNRLVLENMMVHQGARITFAHDGQQAVAAVQAAGANAFDVVLMDVQMPVMDGYAATRNIHAQMPSLPVIGLTAHALTEERDRCLAAGMVAHVTKPFLVEQLVTTILEATATAPRVAVATTPVVAAPALESPPPAVVVADDLIDWAALSARYKQRQAFIDKLLAVTLESHADSAEKLRAAVQAADWETVRFIAHALKGIGGNIEAAPLRALAAQTEQSAQHADAATAAQAAQLADGTDALLALLKQHLAAA